MNNEHEHVHGPGCGHDHTDDPYASARAEMERVNPEMPSAPQIAEPEFVFADTKRQDRPMTTRQLTAWSRFLKAFKVFAQNPAHSTARREAKGAIYDLKVLGVIAHPDFSKSLEKGAADVRTQRRLLRLATVTKPVAEPPKTEASNG